MAGISTRMGIREKAIRLLDDLLELRKVPDTVSATSVHRGSICTKVPLPDRISGQLVLLRMIWEVLLSRR
jgi:hypothetical protein